MYNVEMALHNTISMHHPLFQPEVCENWVEGKIQLVGEMRVIKLWDRWVRLKSDRDATQQENKISRSQIEINQLKAQR